MIFIAASNNDDEHEYIGQSAERYGLTPIFCSGDTWNVSADRVKDCKAAIGSAGRSNVDFEALSRLGVKYFSVRSTGYDHLDLAAAKRAGIRVANAKGYSPNAIADLALSHGLTLLRGVETAVSRTCRLDFQRSDLCAREVRDCTVGVLGTGAIGLTVAGYYKALGARVIGFDAFPNEKADIEYMSLEEVLAQSDIISLHLPYIEGETGGIINARTLALMKQGTVLVNAARGELVDLEAVTEAVESGHLRGYGCDVFLDEGDYLGKSFEDIEDKTLKKALSLYPKILVTPHMGAMTFTARRKMIDIALANVRDFLTDGCCKNEIVF